MFSTEEMEQVSADIDGTLGDYQPDDGRSWWATTADGARRPVRLQYFHEKSPTTASLLTDDRLLRIGRLADDGHRHRSEGNAIEALVKPIGVVEGISDVPWHKDCSLGRHSYRCCSLTVGISVTGADEHSGQLAVVAGSHRALVQPAFVRRSWGLPEVALPTRTGDVTVHCSCTLHMSYPPIERERRVMYTDFVLSPPAGDSVAPGGAAEIARVREQAYKTVNQTPGHLAGHRFERAGPAPQASGTGPSSPDKGRSLPRRLGENVEVRWILTPGRHCGRSSRRAQHRRDGVDVGKGIRAARWERGDRAPQHSPRSPRPSG